METHTHIADLRAGIPPVCLTRDQRLRHLAVLGATGVGKSTLLRQLATQDMARGDGLLLLDPHGDLAHDIAGDVPRWRRNQVCFLDLPDLDFPVGLNVLADPGPDGRAAAVDALVGAMRAIWAESWGPRLETILRHAATVLMATPGASLARLPRLRRGPEPKPFQLTARDVAIVEAVARFRFLTSLQIARSVGGSQQQVLRRLRLLYDHANLDRPAAQLLQLTHVLETGNQPLIYGLGRAGARLVAEQGDSQANKLDWTTKNARATALFLAHTIETADAMIAFWTRVGSAWLHKDGKGFNITLSALPVNGRLVLPEPNEEEDDKAASKPARRK